MEERLIAIADARAKATLWERIIEGSDNIELQENKNILRKVSIEDP